MDYWIYGASGALVLLYAVGSVVWAFNHYETPTKNQKHMMKSKKQLAAEVASLTKTLEQVTQERDRYRREVNDLKCRAAESTEMIRALRRGIDTLDDVLDRMCETYSIELGG